MAEQNSTAPLDDFQAALEGVTPDPYGKIAFLQGQVFLLIAIIHGQRRRLAAMLDVDQREVTA
jgi:hypothetical protein